MATTPGDAVEQLIHEEYARILATLIRVTGDVDAAQDAVQDAVVRALETWPRRRHPGPASRLVDRDRAPLRH